MSTTTTTQNIPVKKPRASSKKTTTKEEVAVVKEVEPKKKGGKKAKKEAVAEEDLLEDDDVVEPVTEVKKKRASKKEEVVEPVTEVKKRASKKVEAVVEESSDGDEKVETVRAEKRTVDRESVMADFDSIIGDINTLIESVRESSNKKGGVGIQSLRGLNARIKTLQKHTCRIAKGKKVKKATCANSGFNKLVDISDEMCKFAGWDITEHPEKSRNDVTRFICDYVKKNDLQYQENRQKIVLDEKLSKLLGTDKDMVTYSGIQTHIKHHYPKKA
jgi:chromatin remodeling complex protein RSC6